MHYILLAIALNLGKENINYMKLADMKVLTRAQKKEIKENKEDIKEKETALLLDPVNELPIADKSFLNDIEAENFAVPYVESNNFAELLPEDEMGNIINNSEEQGPKFLEDIKNKLINITEKKEPEIIIGSQVEGPTFFDNMKNKLLNTEDGKKIEEKKVEKKKKDEKKENIIISEDIGPTFFDNIKNKIFGNEEVAGPKAPTKKEKPPKKSVAPVEAELQGPTFIGKVKDGAAKATEKIKEIDIKKTITDVKQPSFITNIKNKILGKEETKEEIKTDKIVGTLYDSELDQALRDQKISKYRELLSTENYIEAKEVDYKEDEDYQKFIENKDTISLIVPEKILVPNIKPRAKELLSYKKQEIPQDLLDSRSFQNRHIPKIMQEKDNELILEKIIEYGMMPEFRAYMNELRDANLTMSNQYTLLTYATKYKQYPIMKYLIHIGGDVNKRDERLDTPLTIAVQNNDMEAVKILLNANANPDMVDVLKRTPLIYCIEKNQEHIGVYLIENGANINISNGVGEGTLAMSIRLGRNLIKEKIINILRDNK